MLCTVLLPQIRRSTFTSDTDQPTSNTPISRPLSEPKIVKERFDAIFELTGYVKAVKLLRSYQKNLVS